MRICSETSRSRPPILWATWRQKTWRTPTAARLQIRPEPRRTMPRIQGTGARLVNLSRPLQRAGLSLLLMALASGLLTCVPAAQSGAQRKPHRVKTRRVTVHAPQTQADQNAQRFCSFSANADAEPDFNRLFNLMLSGPPNLPSGVRPDAPRIGRAAGRGARQRSQHRPTLIRRHGRCWRKCSAPP